MRPEAIGLKLRALFMSPKDVHAFVDVKEIAYAQAKRIAVLEAALRVVSDELEEEVTAKYPDYALKYQRNVQNLKNDMEGVLMARALLPSPPRNT